MKDILTSASKIVLLSVTFSLCITFIFVVLTGKVEGSVIADVFKVFLGGITGFYFAHKGNEGQEYLGK